MTERTRDLPIATGVGEGRSEGFAGQVAISKSRFLSSAKHSTIPAMLPETHPLIEAVTEPLADNAERRMAAQAILAENFEAGHPAVADLEARLAAAEKPKVRAAWVVAAWVCAALALGIALHRQMPDARIMGFLRGMISFGPTEPLPLPPGLSEKERLLLEEEMDSKRRLHLLEPENPAYYAEYAGEFLSERRKLADDFLEKAAGVAPENAMFIYWAAGHTGGDAVEKTRKGGSTPRYQKGVLLGALPTETEYTIKDAAAYAESLALLEKAAALPGYESYTNRMMAERLSLMPKGTFADYTRALAVIYGTSAPWVFYQRKMVDVMCARAEELSKAGRKEEFLSLVKQREAFLAGMGRNPDMFLVSELVYSVCVSSTAVNFHAAAERLGMADLAETYRKQRDAMLEDKDFRDIRRAGDETSIPEGRASALTHLTLPMVAAQVRNPPLLIDAELEPMRRVEHEVATRLGLTGAALLLLPAGLAVFLFRFVVTPVIRLPARRISRLLGAWDWVLVLALGVALPIAIFLIITRLTPLGGRGYGIQHFQFAFPGVPLVALLLSLLIAPALVIRVRLARWLAPLGIRERLVPLVSLAALTMLLVWALAVLPALERIELSEKVLIGLAALPALCVALIFANALRAILGKPQDRLAQAATALAVLPAYAAAVVALCLMLPMHAAGEKRWLAKETLLRIDPDAPDLGAYEFKVAAQKRKEINAITGAE